MRKNEGFTLIELLIVVAIIGIIAAIAIPNLMNAMDRTKQKKTAADIRALGTVCGQYQIDNNFYPVQTNQGPISNISASLSPVYIKVVPGKDGWNWDLQYGTTAGGTAYTIRSLGKDGVKNGNAGQINDFDCDIIYQDNSFISYPAGTQQ